MPRGPYSPELTLLVNRPRLGPMEGRYILVRTRRSREWTLAKMPTARGAKLELFEDRVFDDYAAARAVNETPVPAKETRKETLEAADDQVWLRRWVGWQRAGRPGSNRICLARAPRV